METSLLTLSLHLLQSLKDQLLFTTFGISTVSLEDVFLRVANDNITTPAIKPKAPTSADRSLFKSASYGSVAQPTSAIEMGVRTSDLNVAKIDEADSSTKLLQRSSENVAGGPVSEGPIGAFGRNMNALLLKRFYNTKRDKKGLCCQVSLFS